MVEVFKTNVEQSQMAEQLISTLRIRFPFSKINFDLEDCDKILRVEAENISVQVIIKLLKQHGFYAEVLI